MIDVINKKFSTSPPLYIASYEGLIKLEMKPYLQPFEEVLAVRELKAILDNNDKIVEEHGFYIVESDIDEEYLRRHLTYWQRIGRENLIPTLQKSLELTQNGIEKATVQSDLHNARRLRYGPHDIHEYRGKFFPQLVKSLINISGVPENAMVLDPMCGSGTTPCEASAANRIAIGADLNPLSVLISEVKTSVILEGAGEFKKTVQGYLNSFKFEECEFEEIWNEEDVKYLKLWFAPDSLSDITAILNSINCVRKETYKKFFRVCLSNIIRSISWQKETDLRVRKEIKPYIKHAAIKNFLEEILRQTDKIYSYLTVLPAVDINKRANIRHGNSVKIDEIFHDFNQSVDVLITSPPYATALPYLDTDRLSLIVLGLLSHKKHKSHEMFMVGTREISEKQRKEAWENYQKRKAELPQNVCDLIDFVAEHNHGDDVGFRRRNLPALLGRYFLDMLDAMRSARKLMKPNASAFYVVGNNSTNVNDKRIDIPTDQFLFDVGEKAGWKKVELIPMELLVSRDIFKENRGTTETILHFKA